MGQGDNLSSFGDSAAVLATLLRVAPMAIAILRRRVFAWVNDGLLTMTGYRREELLGRSARLLYRSDAEFERVGREKYAQIAADGWGSVRTEWRTKEGEGLDVHLSSASLDPTDPDAGVVVTALDVTEQARAEEVRRSSQRLSRVVSDTEARLRERVEIERIVAEIASEHIRLAPEEVDGAIGEALERIGRFTGSDRAYVFLFDDGRDTVTNTHEWVAEGISREKDNLQGLSCAAIPWWSRMVRERRAIALGSLDDLPSEAAAEREHLAAQSIRSLLAVPMHYTDRTIGFLGFDSVRRAKRWTDEDIELLRAVAAVLSNSLVRARIEREKDELEAQLRTSQRLDAVGRLAGGVAHDFNNLLTAIQGHAELLGESLGERDPLQGDVAAIRKAADQAAALTQQLLAFSRRQIIRPRVLDLAAHVRASERMLRRVIREDIDIALALPGAPALVKADPHQVDQLLVHLVVNARDAMPEGGTLTLEVASVELAREPAGPHEVLEPGPYVRLAVHDTGPGMSEEDQARAFEPFFTSKELGQGTGLGLSTVYGIVRQNAGKVELESASGRGTTVSVYLPEAAAPEVPPRPPPPDGDARTSGSILLVEDEPVVLQLARRVLERSGYEVHATADAREALRLVEEEGLRVDLLVTDVVMPELSGRDLLEALRRSRPDLKALFMSGYTENVIAVRGVIAPGVHFLHKPFAVGKLVQMVRELLKAES